MKEVKFGQKVKALNRLRRTSRHIEHRWWKIWEAKQADVSVIVIGIRTLSNGINNCTLGEGCIYTQKNTFRAWLVVTDMHHKPFFTTKIQEISPKNSEKC